MLGVWSGFMPVTSSEENTSELPAFVLKVTSAASSWYYCGGQQNFCRMGMLFALNPTVYALV